jgi:excisionase family DNA binding protein
MWITSGDAMAGKAQASADGLANSPSSRITVLEIARRLNIGRQAVYTMLKQGFIPGLRIGRRWIITRHAYQQWERTCGMQPGAGLVAQPEVTVVH